MSATMWPPGRKRVVVQPLAAVWLPLLLLTSLVLATAGLAAEATVAVRTGSHPGFGRVVFDTTATEPYRISRDGDLVIVSFTGDVRLGPPQSPPRNVQTLRTSDARAEIVVRRDSLVRDSRLGTRVLIDVLDAPARTDAAAPAPLLSMPIPPIPPAPPPAPPPPNAVIQAQAATPAPTAPPASAPEPQGRTPTMTGAAPELAPLDIQAVPRLAVQVTPELPPGPGTNISDAPAVPPSIPQLTAPTGPVALIVKRNNSINGNGAALLLPFAPNVGAAIIPRAQAALVVFDESRPLDMAALRGDPEFGDATVQVSPSATTLRVPLAENHAIILARGQRGWVLSLAPNAPQAQPIAPEPAADRIAIPVDQPGEPVTIAEPDTGATLLVGTQRRSGQAVTVARQTPEFILLPTWLGIAIEPLADTISLRTTPTGFALDHAAGQLVMSPPESIPEALATASHLTRRYDFPTMPVSSLTQRLSRMIGDAAAAPPLARGPKRRMAAETMLSMGLAAEAEALMQVAIGQDPKVAAQPEAHGLKAIAAMLAGRPEEAQAINDTALSGTDDVAFWRAIHQAMQDETSATAAATFAATAPLVFTFPAAIRDHVLPLVLETMIQGGQAGRAAGLLAQRKEDPRLGFARALLAQSRNDTPEALKYYAALANGRDQFDRARATWRAVELRLANHELNPADAIRALDKLLYVWRGDRRELALRLRLAELRAEQGDWRPALAAMRAAETDFPSQAAATRERLRTIFTVLLRDATEKLTPLDLVAVIDENADLLTDVGDVEGFDERLAERVAALDLPGRADTVLSKLIQTTPAGPRRALYGARLAKLRLREEDSTGALNALAVSDGRDLPAQLHESRLLVAASATARSGDTEKALRMLAPLHSADADEARAVIQEQAGAWSGVEASLTAYAAKTVPADGMLSDAHKRTLVRLATAAARAGDQAALAELHGKEHERIGGGPLADLFRLLTAEPVVGTADLRRARQEAGLARAIPAGLQAMPGR